MMIRMVFVGRIWRILKMKPLESVHKSVKWLCLCWRDDTIDIKQKSACIAISLIVSQLHSFLTSAAFTVKLVSTVDLNHTLFACVITMNRMITYFLHQKIPKIFENLHEIYDSCKMHFVLL